MFFKVWESYNFRQEVVKTLTKSYKNIFQFMVDPRNRREMFLWKNDCVTNPWKPQIFLDFALWKMIVSQTRESVFALHFEQWMCHRPSRLPRNPREIFLWKICKCCKHYLLWIFLILTYVRDMFSHNSVNFKLKNSLSISPTNEVWIFMYKFIDFEHFLYIKENDIFYTNGRIITPPVNKNPP